MTIKEKIDKTLEDLRYTLAGAVCVGIIATVLSITPQKEIELFTSKNYFGINPIEYNNEYNQRPLNKNTKDYFDSPQENLDSKSSNETILNNINQNKLELLAYNYNGYKAYETQTYQK
jgi:hypothetical protein